MTWKEKWHDFWRYRFEDFLIKSFLAFLFGGFGVAMILATIDMVGDFRSQEAKLSCYSNQRDAFRFALSDSVICVPYATRQDTTTVKVTQ